MEAFDFSSLPPLPRDYLKMNGTNQDVEEYKDSSEMVQDGGKIGKIQIHKENDPTSNHSNSSDLKCLKPIESGKKSDIERNNEDELKKKNIASNLEQSEHNKINNEDILLKPDLENSTQSYIDENMLDDVEQLTLNPRSDLNLVQDGGNRGYVPAFTPFRSSCFRPMMEASVQANSEVYKMNHPKRGHCLIFTFSDFEGWTRLNKRIGTNEDRDGLKALFTEFSFDVHCFDNLKLAALKSKLNEFGNGVDHRDCDCLVVFFLSHGQEDVLYTSDYSFESKKLIENFTADKCPSLAGKPKMFFIQASQGTGVDDGVTMHHSGRDQTDYSSSNFYSIPCHCDFMICYAIGFSSLRNTINGSWFVQALIKVFRQLACQHDVLEMMCFVNRQMIIDFESNCPSNPRGMNGVGTQSTLIRQIFLKPQHCLLEPPLDSTLSTDIAMLSNGTAAPATIPQEVSAVSKAPQLGFIARLRRPAFKSASRIRRREWWWCGKRRKFISKRQ